MSNEARFEADDVSRAYILEDWDDAMNDVVRRPRPGDRVTHVPSGVSGRVTAYVGDGLRFEPFGFGEPLVCPRRDLARQLVTQWGLMDEPPRELGLEA